MQHLSDKSTSAENEAWRNTTPPSVVTDVEGDPYANATTEIVLGNKRANDSKPEGDHNVFTHDPKDPNCDVCGMTKTTRARCKNRLLKRPDGISLSSFGDLITADHKILDRYSF